MKTQHKKDPYAILGVKATASDEDIKRAFRQKALALHTDRNKSETQSSEEFSDLIEAYNLLSDPSRRRQFDGSFRTWWRKFVKGRRHHEAAAKEAKEKKEETGRRGQPEPRQRQGGEPRVRKSGPLKVPPEFQKPEPPKSASRPDSTSASPSSAFEKASPSKPAEPVVPEKDASIFVEEPSESEGSSAKKSPWKSAEEILAEHPVEDAPEAQDSSAKRAEPKTEGRSAASETSDPPSQSGVFAGTNDSQVSLQGPKVSFPAITVDFETAILGGTQWFTLALDTPCVECHGLGVDLEAEGPTCPDCRGLGIQQGTKCPRCLGRGFLATVACASCAGQGFQREQQRVRLTIPPGSNQSDHIAIPSQDGKSNLPAWAELTVKPHPIFQRQGLDLFTAVSVNLAQLMYGDAIEVPVLGGKVKLELPSSVEPGSLIKLKGYGVPASSIDGMTEDRPGDEPGNLYVALDLEMPTLQNKTMEKRFYSMAKGLKLLDEMSTPPDDPSPPKRKSKS
jgi:DnaJ-class molecular chaperone